MISENFAYAVCKDDIALIENYDKAIADTKMWVCHHKAGVLPCGRFSREDLKKFNLYFHRPANELIFLTKSEHLSLHSKGITLKNSTKLKISKTLYNKRLSEEEKRKRKAKMISKGTYYGRNHSTKNRHWYNNGLVSVLSFEKPDGFSEGMLNSTKDKHKGDKNPNFGKPMPDERKEKLSKNSGSHRQEVRDKISKTRIERRCGIGNKNAVGGKGHKGLKWITNRIIEKTIPIGENPPEGFRFGRCCNKCRKK